MVSSICLSCKYYASPFAVNMLTITFQIISGDSYSSVGYQEWTIEQFPHPSVDNPLGIPFPGQTWTDDSEGMGDCGMSRNPNWVGHFVTSRRNAGNPIVVYDYAHGGHAVPDMRRQITEIFSGHVASQPEWAPWKENDSLFGMRPSCCSLSFASR